MIIRCTMCICIAIWALHSLRKMSHWRPSCLQGSILLYDHPGLGTAKIVQADNITPRLDVVECFVGCTMVVLAVAAAKPQPVVVVGAASQQVAHTHHGRNYNLVWDSMHMLLNQRH